LGYEDAAASLFDGTGSFGNGAAMRVAPVALVPPPGDDTEVARLARVQARLTHTHPDGVEGAAVVARIVARLLAVETPDTEMVRRTVTEVVDATPAGVLRDRLHDALAELDAHGDAARAAARVGTGVAAAASVPAAVVAVLAGHDLLGTITTAIGFGGDADTIAAMAGAMGGAAWGLDGVPVAMLARLEARDELADLATRLRGVGGGEPIAQRRRVAERGIHEQAPGEHERHVGVVGPAQRRVGAAPPVELPRRDAPAPLEGGTERVAEGQAEQDGRGPHVTEAS
jgi:poly(ADP-ribose) glycohydrolase ARH3